jgi:hypothetical protein
MSIFPCTTAAHVLTEAVNEVDGPGDIGVHDMQDVVEVLIKEAFAEAAPRIGQQCIDGPITDHAAEFVDAFERRKVRFYRLYPATELFQIFAGRLEFWFVGSNDQIQAIPDAAFGQFVSDARRSTRYNGK